MVRKKPWVKDGDYSASPGAAFFDDLDEVKYYYQAEDENEMAEMAVDKANTVTNLLKYGNIGDIAFGTGMYKEALEDFDILANAVDGKVHDNWNFSTTVMDPNQVALNGGNLTSEDGSNLENGQNPEVTNDPEINANTSELPGSAQTLVNTGENNYNGVGIEGMVNQSIDTTGDVIDGTTNGMTTVDRTREDIGLDFIRGIRGDSPKGF